MSDRAKSWFARWKVGQNLKNSYLPHRGELRPHIWGGEPWPTYLQNDPKLERFRDFGTPNLGTPTTITTVKRTPELISNWLNTYNPIQDPRSKTSDKTTKLTTQKEKAKKATGKLQKHILVHLEFDHVGIFSKRFCHENLCEISF